MMEALLTALRTRLLTVSGLPPRAWENVNFVPEIGDAYVTDRWLGGSAQAAEVGDRPLRRGRYLYQINVVSPNNRGMDEIMALADDIASVFQDPMDVGGVPARPVSVRVGPPLVESSNWYSFPISVSVDYDF